jgi:Holliday junction resolvase RusA-like endonuclease
MILNLVVLGAPVPKGRPRMTRRGFAYTPKKTREAEADLRSQVIAQLPEEFKPLQTPLEILVKAYRMRPKSAKKNQWWVVTRPDADNYLKTVMDGLNGIVYIDDSQIVMAHVSKLYTTEQPRVEIVIKELEI